MKWKKGRRNTGYEKLTIVSSQLFKFDIHLIRMRPGDRIDTHVDPIPQKYLSKGYRSHHRLNIILNKNYGGGLFGLDVLNHNHKRRFFKFRPDIQKHWVTPVYFGTRYVLSIGWLSKHEK